MLRKVERWESTFMAQVAHKQNVKSMEDWYKITREDIVANGGSTLLSKYRDSPFKLITSTYPDHEWLPWKFQNVPKGYWADKSNERKFLDWLHGALRFKDMEDWYKITAK